MQRKSKVITELFRFVFPKPSNSNVHFKVTTVILIGTEKWQQQDKVVAKKMNYHVVLHELYNTLFLSSFYLQSDLNIIQLRLLFASICRTIFMENFYVHFTPKLFVLAIYHFTWQGIQDIKSHSCFLVLEDIKS